MVATNLVKMRGKILLEHSQPQRPTIWEPKEKRCEAKRGQQKVGMGTQWGGDTKNTPKSPSVYSFRYILNA